MMDFDGAQKNAVNDRVADTRFHQIDRDSIAVYDAVTQRVHALHLSVNEGRIEVVDLWAVSVSDTSDSGAPRGRERFWLSDHFWRAAIVGPVEARGIITRDTPWEERVSLAE